MLSPNGRGRWRRCTLALAFALLPAACDAPARPAPVAAPGDAREAAASAGQEPAAAPEIDPAAQVAAAVRGAPRDVVSLLLAWDTADLRYAAGYEEALRSAYCMGGERPCATDEQGWDHLAVVNGYQVDALHESADSAAYGVVHDEIGFVWLGGMEYTQGSPPVTIALRRLEDGWRIVGIEPALRPHLSPSALLRRYAGVQPDSAMLARWVARRE